MCDEKMLDDWETHLRSTGNLTRRQFGALSVGAGMAMMLPKTANAVDVTGGDVQITTPDGTADCYFVHPSSGSHPGVLVWPDALGLRPAFRQMGDRLAQSGYAVLTVNQYYRSTTAPIVKPNETFAQQGVRDRIIPLMQTLSPETNVTDANAFVSWLDDQPSVDTGRGIGTTGYCMGGPITMRTAAAIPNRIGAAASFHGGGLVTDNDNSPHLLVPQMKAHYLIAIAENDDENEPDAKDALRAAFRRAGVPAEIEVYDGALHGWCPLDGRVYHHYQAERAWARLLALFEKALA